jgi:hypothetical protein
MFRRMPTTLPALATMYGADRSAEAQMYSAQQQAAAQAAAAASAAAGQQGAARYAGMGNAESSRQSGLAGAYGGYATGLAGIANAMSNERASSYGAMAQAEAARQLAAGNIANQALAAYGGMGNAAMSAWGVNQAAYNQALSGMFGANQMAASQLGQSRNQALAGLGGSVSQLGRGLAAADAVSNVDFGMGGMGGMGGGGFSASGPSGPIASGSYSGGMPMGGMGDMSGGGSRGAGPNFASTADRSFGELASLRGGVMENTFLDNLTAGRDAGMRQLDNQHYSSREMPMQFMGQALSGLMQLSEPGYSQLAGGMNQLYGNLQASRPDFSPYGSALTSGFGSTLREGRDGMNQFYDRMGSSAQGGGFVGGGGFSPAPIPNSNSPIASLLGNLSEFQTPYQRTLENLRARELNLGYTYPKYQPKLPGTLARGFN